MKSAELTSHLSKLGIAIKRRGGPDPGWTSSHIDCPGKVISFSSKRELLIYWKNKSFERAAARKRVITLVGLMDQLSESEIRAVAKWLFGGAKNYPRGLSRLHCLAPDAEPIKDWMSAVEKLSERHGPISNDWTKSIYRDEILRDRRVRELLLKALRASEHGNVVTRSIDRRSPR